MPCFSLLKLLKRQWLQIEGIALRVLYPESGVEVVYWAVSLPEWLHIRRIKICSVLIYTVF